MSKNHPKIYTKPPNGGCGNKQRDLAWLKTWPRNRQKDRVRRRQNSLHVYPRLNKLTSVFYASVLSVIDHEFRHHIVKVAVDPRGDKFMINNRTDALKTDINLFLR